jgi:hypothetical protein
MLDAEAFKLTCDVSNRASRRLLPLGVPRAYAPNAQPERRHGRWLQGKDQPELRPDGFRTAPPNERHVDLHAARG